MAKRMRKCTVGALCLAVTLTVAAAQSTEQEEGQPARQHGQKLGVQPAPAAAHRNLRLILTDGSYQLVKEYKLVGDRVRYLSVERGGEWEELPADLVDWDATRKWEKGLSKTNIPEDEAELSPAMREARRLDEEEAAERRAVKARTPRVLEGLDLPDADGVFALDRYQGTPALVELPQADLNLNQKTRRGVNLLNPLAGQKASLELEGAHAQVHLHVPDPAIYISLDVEDRHEPGIAHSYEVTTTVLRAADTRKHGAHSQSSGFAIVRLDERRALRIVGALHVSVTGEVRHDENTIPAKTEVVEGKHWLKITPTEKLLTGEYALVEILSSAEMNQTVWDFRVDPAAGDNPGSLTPIPDAPKR